MTDAEWEGHYRNLLLLTHVLVARLGGEAAISDEELSEISEQDARWEKQGDLTIIRVGDGVDDDDDDDDEGGGDASGS